MTDGGSIRVTTILSRGWFVPSMGIVERLRAGVQRSVVQLGGGHSPDPAPLGGFLSLPLVGQLAHSLVAVHLERRKEAREKNLQIRDDPPKRRHHDERKSRPRNRAPAKSSLRVNSLHRKIGPERCALTPQGAAYPPALMTQRCWWVLQCARGRRVGVILSSEPNGRLG